MTYLSEVIADAPIHYWRCADPGGGLGHDIGSAPKHLHAIGNPSFGYSGPNTGGGSLDACLTGQYANIGIAEAIAGGRITLECFVWVFQNLVGAGQFLYMISGGANQTALARTGTNWSAAYNGVACISPVGYVAQQWRHLALTYDLTNVRLYIDGVQQAIAAAGAMVGYNSMIEVGASVAVQFFGTCFFSEVAVYSTTLTAARLAAHFAAADQVSQAPVFQQAGTFSGTTGSSSSVGGNLDDIYAAVHRTLP